MLWYGYWAESDSRGKLGGRFTGLAGRESAYWVRLIARKKSGEAGITRAWRDGPDPGQRDEAVAGWVILELPLYIAWFWAKRNP